MPPHDAIAFRTPRRRDRAMPDEAWILELLDRAPFGVLALAGEDGPKAVPNLFAFDPAARAVYLHAARHGETRDGTERGSRASFCVAEMGRLLPAGAAVDFSVEYASVVLEGRSSIVEDPAEATRALELLMTKYAPHLQPERHYRPVEARDLARTSVVRIEVERWSGKANVSSAAGAYAYRAAPDRDPAQEPPATIEP